MPRSQDDDSDDDLPEDYFEVERIVDGRKYRGRWQFLVKWCGYPDSENSWVFQDDFGDACRDMIREWQSSRQLKNPPPKPEKPLSRVSRSKKPQRSVSSSSSSSNGQTDSLSDDHLPLGNRLRNRKSISSGAPSRDSLNFDKIPHKKRSESASLPRKKKRSLKRKDSELSVDSNQTVIITDNDQDESFEPMAVVNDTTKVTQDLDISGIAAVEHIVDIPAIEQTVDIPAIEQTVDIPAIVDISAIEHIVDIPSAVPIKVEGPADATQSNAPQSAPVVQSPAVEPPSFNADRADQEPPLNQLAIVEKTDPNADILTGSLLSRDPPPQDRFPKSVSEICDLMGSLDERERIELIDHLTFSVGYAEMFVLISSQRPFLRTFEEWLLEAYKSGSPMSIAFIRSALTLMAVFPSNKIANYKRLIRVIREWFVVDAVCLNLADRILKQWQYYKELSQGRPSLSRACSPTSIQGDAVSSMPISSEITQSAPVAIRQTAESIEPPISDNHPPETAAPILSSSSVAVSVQSTETSEPSASIMQAAAPVELTDNGVNAILPSGDSDMAFTAPTAEVFPVVVANNTDLAVSTTSNSQQPIISEERSLNQVEVEQDNTISYMPAGIDDDLEYPIDDDSTWAVSI